MTSPVHWPRAAGYGVLWGVAVTAMESLELPLGSLTAPELLLFHAKLLPHLCVAGIVLAASAISTAGQRVGPGLLAWLLVGFPTITSLMNLAIKPLIDSHYLWATAGDSGYPHTYWTSLFYGSLFVAAFHLNARSERTRRLLARSEIARQQAAASLTAAQFQALRGHVNPAFMQRAILKVRTLYSMDPAAADRLLDRLVGFLRAAMPGVRSGTSTLATELELARVYSQLLRELDPDRPVLEVDVMELAIDLPFPALLLLPVLDQLAASDSGQPIRLRAHQHGGSCLLTVHACGLDRSDWLSAELKYRLQVGLRTLFGGACELTLGDAHGRPVLSLTFPLALPGSPSLTLRQEVSYG